MLYSDSFGALALITYADAIKSLDPEMAAEARELAKQTMFAAESKYDPVLGGYDQSEEARSWLKDGVLQVLRELWLISAEVHTYF